MERIIAIFDGVIADSKAAKEKYAQDVLGLDENQNDPKRRHFVKLIGETKGNTLNSGFCLFFSLCEHLITCEPTTHR